MRRTQAVRVERADQVEIDHGAEVVEIERTAAPQRTTRLAATGGVDRDMETAERVDRLVDHHGDPLEVEYVRGMPGTAQRGRHLGTGGLLPVEDRHRAAAGDDPLRRRPSEARSSTDDDRLHAWNLHGAVPLSLSVLVGPTGSWGESTVPSAPTRIGTGDGATLPDYS